MLDKLPAQLRHFILIVGAAFFSPFIKAILVAQGVTGIAWHSLLISSINTAVVAGVSSNVLLNLTPLTRQYGAFATPPAAVQDPAVLKELADTKQALADAEAKLALPAPVVASVQPTV